MRAPRTAWFVVAIDIKTGEFCYVDFGAGQVHGFSSPAKAKRRAVTFCRKNGLPMMGVGVIELSVCQILRRHCAMKPAPELLMVSDLVRKGPTK